MPKATPPGHEEIALRADEFRLLRDLISAKTGILFEGESRFLLERRLRERLAVLGLHSFAEYHHYLRFHPKANEEWDEAMERLTTNETYFFREQWSLRAFRDELLPILEQQAQGRRRLSIWSAGCSTGEEVYTLAMIVHESGLFDGWEVRIYGSDISRRCVAVAREGVYGAASFRVTPPEVKKRHFVERDGAFQVTSEIRAMCHFAHMNLLHTDRVHLVGRQDAVFCRNVLIYIASGARRRIIEMFHERLYPGGVLVLGHSESLLNVSTAFELLHLRNDLVYRKPQGQLRESGTWVVRAKASATDEESD